MNIVVISDTHIRGEMELPAELLEELKKADLLIHCGDYTAEEVYQQFYLLMQGRMLAVAGNSDQTFDTLPQIIETELAGFKIMIMHGHQTTADRLYRFAPEADLIITGHQHHPEFCNKEKPYLLNPGSLTNNRYLNYNSFALLELTPGLEPAVRFIELEK